MNSQRTRYSRLVYVLLAWGAMIGADIMEAEAQRRGGGGGGRGGGGGGARQSIGGGGGGGAARSANRGGGAQRAQTANRGGGQARSGVDRGSVGAGTRDVGSANRGNVGSGNRQAGDRQIGSSDRQVGGGDRERNVDRGDRERNVDRERGNNNVNIDNDTNINVDGGDYGWDNDWDYHPIAAGVAFGTAAAITSAAIGSMYYSLPAGCAPRPYNSISYYYCGNVWYQPAYSGTSVSYTVVNAPY